MKSSWFKYISWLSKLRKILGRRHYNRSTPIWSSQPRHRAHNPFFNRPYIEVDKPNPYCVKIIMTKGVISRSNPETFLGIVWTLPVTNREKRPLRIPLTKTAIDCQAKMHIRVDNTGTGNEIPLLWKPYGKFPTECSTDFNIDGNRLAYTKYLGYHYTESLALSRIRKVSIPRGLVYELYFLFTFKESNYAYIICDLKVGGMSHEGQVFYLYRDGFPLARPFQEQLKFQLRFHSEGYPNGMESQYICTVKSWDSVSLERI